MQTQVSLVRSRVTGDDGGCIPPIIKWPVPPRNPFPVPTPGPYNPLPQPLA
jgi:hypothetical protein